MSTLWYAHLQAVGALELLLEVVGLAMLRSDLLGGLLVVGSDLGDQVLVQPLHFRTILLGIIMKTLLLPRLAPLGSDHAVFLKIFVGPSCNLDIAILLHIGHD